MKTKHTLSTLLLVLVSTLALAGGKLQVKGNILDPLHDYDAVTLEVVVNGSEVHTIPFSRKGEFQVRIYDNEHYVFNFKREGYITKSIVIDTHVPAEHGLVGNIEFNIFMERMGRKSPVEKICAIYNWSDTQDTLVYTEPEDDKQYIALNK